MLTTSFAAADVDALRSQVAGPVFVRGDDGLAGEVVCFNLAVVHTPDIVVGATSAADVAAAVRFAARHGLHVSAQATGHGATEPITDGMLMTTSRLDALSIDHTSCVASIGAGLRWAPVIAAGAELGLAPICGSSPNVGAVGYTLGGGLGPLGRTYGFSADYARGFEVVTADSEIRLANQTEHPDLFWALCGGKGGLGVATSMQFELVPLTRVYGGGLYFDADQIEAALRGWADWVKTAPEAATTSVALIRFPPLDAIPAPLRGRTILHVRYAFVGDTQEGERVIAPLRAAAPARMDTVAEMTPASIGSIHNDPPGPLPSWVRGMLLKSIGQDFVTKLLALVGPGKDVPIIAVEVRHIAGAPSRAPEGGNAVGGRQSPFSLAIVGAPAPALFESALPRFADVLSSAIGAWVAPETNINFGMPIPSMKPYVSAWPAPILERLEGIRAKYDPTRIFAFEGA